MDRRTPRSGRSPVRTAIWAAVALIATTGGGAHAADLLTNGSFEDLNNVWVDQGGGFDSITAGTSVQIPGWTVTSATASDVAWGSSASFIAPADGNYFVDITGIGSDSPHGGLQQTISVVTGATYTIDLYVSVINDEAIGVSVDGNDVGLTTPLGNGYAWTLLEGSFVGGANTMPVFTIFDATGAGAAALIDLASITGPAVDTPEPASIGLFAMAVTGLAGVHRRRRG